MALDLQPIQDQSQQSTAAPAPAVSQAPVQQSPVTSPGNSGKLDLQPMLDLQPIGDQSTNDQSKITPFEQGMTKQLYNNVPFGKYIIKGTDAIAGTHMASDIESNTPPATLGEKAGEFVGGVLSLFPAWEAGAALAGPLNATAKLAAGSMGVGAQSGQEALNTGKQAPEALEDAASTAGSTFVGGKALEGLGNVVSPMLQGLAGHGDVYRNLLNPGKGVVNDIEVKSGKDINDAFQTMADERLPIKSVIQNNRDTIDTNEARAQVKGKISGLYDQLQQKLQGSDAQFNLDDLKTQVDNKLRPIFKNDSDYESAQAEVDKEFEAMKRQRIPGYADQVDQGGEAPAPKIGDLFQTDGAEKAQIDPVVDAPTLSNIKEGMWQKGYNLLAPNSQKVSRIIGNTLKQAIEDAHPEDTDIKDLNQQMGQLQTVDGILQKTHGKVVNGGALGNYLRGGVGAIVGEQLGMLLGHPVIGTGVGGFVGEQTNRLFNNPELITSALSKIRDIHEFGGSMADHAQDLAQKFGLTPKTPAPVATGATAPANPVFDPEVMGGKALPPPQPKIGLNRALPSPAKAGQSSGPTIPAEAQEGQVYKSPLGLPPSDTVYGPGFTMQNYKPKPMDLEDADRKDLEDFLDWTSSQQKGERYSFINGEGQREFGGTPSGHAQSVQDIGPKHAQELMQKALLNKPVTPMQEAKVRTMLQDFQTNIKPKMNAEAPVAEGEVQGNTENPEQKPLGPDLGSNKGSVDISGKTAPTFYSQAAKTIDDKMPNAATPDQIRGILSPANGVKPDELKWMGMDDFLAGKTKVSKADFQNFIKQNQIQIKEVEKSDVAPRIEKEFSKQGMQIGKEMGGEIQVFGKDGEIIDPEDLEKSHPDLFTLAKEYEDNKGEYASQGPKFSQYQLPGGKNYREMLLTLPEKSGGIKGPKGWADTSGGTSDTKNFQSPHFDEPNILAHIRMNDRIDADGKKNLFIEEVQSDWHQKGKQLGYRGTTDLSPQQVNDRVSELENKGINASSAEKQEWAKLKSIQENKGVPDAPFQKTWHELAMKRMLRYAAENGYDRLSWTTGAQQAERYDLSKQVDKVRVTKRSDGTYNIAVNKKGESSLTPIKQVATEQELPELIGKDLAKKVIGQDVGPVKTYEGGDLKVGGEGMKGFYDQILPSFMNKYAKKWGASVQDGRMNLSDQSPENSKIEQLNKKVHSIDITPAMKKSVMTQGQPLFNWNPTTVTGAAGLGIGAAIGAKNAKADTLRPIVVPGNKVQDRLKLAPADYTKKEEGFRGSVYKDTLGHNTVGYGFNVDDPGIKKMIPDDVLSGKRELTTKEADTVFSKVYDKSQSDAVRFVGNRAWSNLSQGQKKGLSDISYNLGFHKLSGFKKMQTALQSGDWQKASTEILSSKYASEVPNRARRNAQLIGNG